GGPRRANLPHRLGGGHDEYAVAGLDCSPHPRGDQERRAALGYGIGRRAWLVAPRRLLPHRQARRARPHSTTRLPLRRAPQPQPRRRNGVSTDETRFLDVNDEQALWLLHLAEEGTRQEVREGFRRISLPAASDLLSKLRRRAGIPPPPWQHEPTTAQDH